MAAWKVPECWGKVSSGFPFALGWRNRPFLRTLDPARAAGAVINKKFDSIVI